MLLPEASGERSKRVKKTYRYHRGLALFAVGLMALLSFSVPALGQQSAPRHQSVLPADNKDATLANATSSTTTPKASFASGSGVNFLGVKVSDHGNLLSFESPANQEAVFGGREGYAICSSNGSTVHAHDTGDVEAGFGTPTFSQPNGAGTFPLTVTRNTTDGKFQLTQVWAKPDPVEKDVTVTMTLKNISSASINGVLLSRSGDFDVGTASTDRGALTNDSAWLWDDSSGPDSPPGGLMLTALTFGTGHITGMEPSSSWVGSTSTPGSRTHCGSDNTTTPTAAGDFSMSVLYDIETLNAGQSKIVKFEYGRM
jgi:hypothetical protein